MADIWTGIGVDLGRSSGEWLYRVGGEVRGPIPEKALIDKLLRGDIDLDTPVAIEGGEFHPIVRVAAFSEQVEEAQRLARKRAAAKVRRALLLVLLVVAAGGAGGGFFLYDHYKKVQADKAAQAKALADDLTRKREQAGKEGPLALVELVKFNEEDLKIQKRPATPHKGGHAETEEFVSSCERGQGEIMGTLSQSAGKLSVCIGDEKKRDTQGLLPSTLPIEFVVRPDGKVIDFAIADRHYRTGMLNNCLTKVFNQMHYAAAKGSNCPVSIPMTIGK